MGYIYTTKRRASEVMDAVTEKGEREGGITSISTSDNDILSFQVSSYKNLRKEEGGKGRKEGKAGEAVEQGTQVWGRDEKGGEVEDRG